MQGARLFSARGTSLKVLVYRLRLLLPSAVIVFVTGFLFLLVGMRIAFAGEVLPGVSIAGINIVGITDKEIERKLQGHLTYPQIGLIVFHDDDRLWTAHPEDLGVSIEFAAMAQEAIRFGRQGHFLKQFIEQARLWFFGETIAPVIVFDQEQAYHFLSKLAGTINVAQREASIEVRDVEVIAYPGKIGRQLDIDATIQALAEPISRMYDAQIDLVVREGHPLILDASREAAIAEAILSQPLELTTDDAGPWEIEPELLAKMLQFDIVQEAGSAKFEVGLDLSQLTTWLEPLALGLNRLPQNARFIFNDDTRELDLLQPSMIGRTLEIPATVEAIQQGLLNQSHEVPLVFEYHEPEVTENVTASELGIEESVSVFSSYFSGSDPARVHNIKTAASAFHGLLVPPGATLSMAEVIGDISLDKGYAEALIIFGDRTIKGVGGGVCQVSTTLFRTAFFGGYPIVERHPHAYRVGFYERGPSSPGPGFDAAVFVPVVDLKFINDRSSWLLMETYVYSNRLEWKFYSASDGRTVRWYKEEMDEVKAPEPLYKENPELPEGEIKQVDWEADGLDVIVTRIVERDGKTLFEDIFQTHYLPWRAIYEYGPGTELPEDAKTE